MLRYILDTDHLTLFQYGLPALGTRLSAQPPRSVGVSVVSVEEALRGRLAQLSRATDGPTRIHRYAMLSQTVQLFGAIPVTPFDPAAESHFQALRSIRIGSQDLKIAAIALANQLTLLTPNQRDFARISGLQVEDWSV